MNNNQGRRRTRRVRQQRKQKNTQISRILLTICMMALVAVVSIGGTMAWLQDSSDKIENKFTATNVGVTLTETKGLTGNQWNNQLIPGKVYEKDPTVVVDAGTNVPVILFVERKIENEKVPETETKYYTYTDLLNADNGWTNLKDDIWYRVVAANASEEDRTFELIGDNKITVNPDLTKDQTNITEADKLPSISYQAFVIQQETTSANPGETTNFDPLDAWNTVKGITP